MPENNESPDREVTHADVQDGGEISENSSPDRREDNDLAAAGVSASNLESNGAEETTTAPSRNSDEAEQPDLDSGETATRDEAGSDESAATKSEVETQEKSESADFSGSSVESTEDPQQASTPTADASQAENVVSEGETTAKKRKRRKRRKQTAETDSNGDSPSEEGAKKAKRKDASMVPFARFLPGPISGKKHVFAVNEVVAGRVIRCEQGAIVVDLFGKALAIADEFEPRDIPIQEQITQLETGTEKASSEPSDTEAVAPTIGVVEEGVIQEGETQITESEDSSGESKDETEVATEAPDDSITSSVAIETSDDSSTDAVESGAAPIEQGVAAEEGEVESADDSAEHALEVPAELAETDGVSEDTKDESTVDNRESPAEECVPEIPPDPPKIGQIFKGRIGAVAESGHVALVNRIIDIEAARNRIEECRTQHKRVLGLVFGFNRGGFDVIVEGIRAFCPASGMSLETIDNPKDHIGKKLEFTVPASKGSSKDLIISRRSILEKEHRKKVKEFLRSLKRGQKCEGKVTQIREYGLFVDIGGVEGLVHQSELSFAFGAKPQDVAQVGDEIEVQVIKVTAPGDSKKESKRDRSTRVDLSIKALLPDPWDTRADAVSEGSVQQGKVIRTTDFGAFVELAPSIEGLLHISELGRDLKHANQVLKEGDEIYVVVERADKKTRRISLSKLSDSAVEDYKQGRLIEPGERPQSLQPGARVKVKVDAFEARGLVVRVLGAAGKRGRGYIPNNETGTERGTDLRKKFPISTELEVKIIGVERDGSLKCSIKAVALDDERRAIKEYRREASKQGFGTFGDLLKAKLGEVSRD